MSSVLDGATQRRPFAGEGGRTGAKFEAAVLRDGTPVIVKHVRPDDWLVLVTGASGFVGSAVAAAFRDAGYRVRAFVRASSPKTNVDPRDEESAGTSDRFGWSVIPLGSPTVQMSRAWVALMCSRRL